MASEDVGLRSSLWYDEPLGLCLTNGDQRPEQIFDGYDAERVAQRKTKTAVVVQHCAICDVVVHVEPWLFRWRQLMSVTKQTTCARCGDDNNVVG